MVQDRRQLGRLPLDELRVARKLACVMNKRRRGEDCGLLGMLGGNGVPALVLGPAILGIRDRSVVDSSLVAACRLQLDPLAARDPHEGFAHDVVIQIASLGDFEPRAVIHAAPVDDNVHVRMIPVGVERRVIIEAVAPVIPGTEHFLRPCSTGSLGGVVIGIGRETCDKMRGPVGQVRSLGRHFPTALDCLAFSFVNFDAHISFGANKRLLAVTGKIIHLGLEPANVGGPSPTDHLHHGLRTATGKIGAGTATSCGLPRNVLSMLLTHPRADGPCFASPAQFDDSPILTHHRIECGNGRRCFTAAFQKGEDIVHSWATFFNRSKPSWRRAARLRMRCICASTRLSSFPSARRSSMKPM